MGTIRALSVILGAALLLTACQGPPAPLEEDGDCMPVPGGPASDSVIVTGTANTAPQVRFDSLGTVYATQRTVVHEGRGRMADHGALVTFSYAVYDGSNGEQIDAVGFDGHHAQATLDGSSLTAGLSKALLCSPQGSRVVAVVPPDDAFGPAGDTAHGVSGTRPLVLVVDLVAVAGDRADGKPREQDDPRLPRVTVGATGEPRLSIPPVPPPSETVTKLLKEGTGEVVAEGATVSVEYLGAEWKSGRIFDSSWKTRQPVRRPTSGFIAGFGKALVGSTVGSQLLVVVPSTLGFDDAARTKFGLDRSDTVVFVIDVLAVTPPPSKKE